MGHGLPAKQRLTKAAVAVDEFIAVAAAVAEKVAVHRAVVAVADAAQLFVTCPRKGVAAEAAIHAERGGCLQVPFPSVVPHECFVIEDPGRADFDEVATELVFQHPIGVPAEIDGIVRAEDVEIAATRVIAIEADATIAGNAAIHLMVDERSEILVVVRAFLEAEFTIVVTGHDGHVLQVTLAAFVANRAVVRVIDHQPFNNAGTELAGLGVVDGEAQTIRNRRHAGHDDAACSVLVIFE